MFWRVYNKSWRRVNKTSDNLSDTSSRDLEAVLKTSLQSILKTCDQCKCICLNQDVLKTSSSRRMFATVEVMHLLQFSHFSTFRLNMTNATLDQSIKPESEVLENSWCVFEPLFCHYCRGKEVASFHFFTKFSYRFPHPFSDVLKTNNPHPLLLPTAHAA